MNKQFLTFFFIATSFIIKLNGQFIQVSGFIFQKGTEQTIPFANIVNTRNKTGATSNASGFYTILLKAEDTVEVSAVGFKKRRYGLPSSISAGSFSFDVYLEKDIIDLDTVKVGPYTLEKFKEEFSKMPLKEKEKLVVGDPSVYKNYRQSPTTFGLHLNGPFSWIYNKLSKKTREKEKLRDLQSGENVELTGSMKLNRKIVMEVTGLEGNEVDQFIAWCNFPNEDLAHVNEYDFKIMVKEKYDVYQKLPNKELIKDSIPK